MDSVQCPSSIKKNKRQRTESESEFEEEKYISHCHQLEGFSNSSVTPNKRMLLNEEQISSHKLDESLHVYLTPGQDMSCDKRATPVADPPLPSLIPDDLILRTES